MKEIFAVRNVDEKTILFINAYAREHKMKTGDALREIVSLAQEYVKEQSRMKKYRSIFAIHDKLKFSSENTELRVN
ncbi:MAG: hypothetical protein ABH842_01855 [Candidatus Micrarchaeota archaeon]